LNLSEYINKKTLLDCETKPQPDEPKVFKKIPVKANRCVALLNYNNSYHSTIPWANTKSRRFMYIILNKKSSESIWSSSYSGLDATPPSKKVIPNLNEKHRIKLFCTSGCLEVQWA
jgi:hypothetical protein